MSRTHILGIPLSTTTARPVCSETGQSWPLPKEERFTRKKGDASVPARAAAYRLQAGGITAADLAYVGFYDKPLLKFERILFMAAPVWMKDKLHTDRQVREALAYAGEILYAEHHESHAASAFFPSPFEQAAILTMDGGRVGDGVVRFGRGSEIEIMKELHWPDSLGLLYSASEGTVRLRHAAP